MALKGRVKRIVVPLVVGSHFEHWGFEPDSISWDDPSKYRHPGPGMSGMTGLGGIFSML